MDLQREAGVGGHRCPEVLGQLDRALIIKFNNPTHVLLVWLTGLRLPRKCLLIV
jgi:hypothetical protein